MIYKLLNKLRQTKYLLNRYFFHIFLKSNLKGIKKGMKIYGNFLPVIKGVKNITIGENFRINEYVYINARGTSEIIIGDSVTISSYAKLITATYDVQRLMNGEKDLFLDIHNDRSIVIGNNCWIGMGALILPGVNLLGENIIIAAGSVVSKGFSESNVLIGGNPAKIIKNYV